MAPTRLRSRLAWAAARSSRTSDACRQESVGTDGRGAPTGRKGRSRAVLASPHGSRGRRELRRPEPEHVQRSTARTAPARRATVSACASEIDPDLIVPNRAQVNRRGRASRLLGQAARRVGLRPAQAPSPRSTASTSRRRSQDARGPSSSAVVMDGAGDELFDIVVQIQRPRPSTTSTASGASYGHIEHTLEHRLRARTQKAGGRTPSRGVRPCKHLPRRPAQARVSRATASATRTRYDADAVYRGLGADGLVGIAPPVVRRRSSSNGPAGDHRRAHRQGDPRAPRFPPERRAGLPDARPHGAHALRRREPAHPPRHADRHAAHRRALRPRRAVDRPPPARQQQADRQPGGAARPR